MEKLEAAKAFRLEGKFACICFYKKTKGNNCVRDKEYEKAAYMYQKVSSSRITSMIQEYDALKALVHFDYTFPDTEEENLIFDKEKEACHLNMALVKFNLKDYDETINHCDQVTSYLEKRTKT